GGTSQSLVPPYGTTASFASAVTDVAFPWAVARSVSGMLNGPQPRPNRSTTSPACPPSGIVTGSAVTPVQCSGITAATVTGPLRSVARLTLTGTRTSPP